MHNAYLGWFYNSETKEFERWRGKKIFLKPSEKKDD